MELTKYQVTNATMFFNKHQNHVQKLANLDVPAYPPTDAYDKANPPVWKANHWKWFLDTHKPKQS